VYVYNSSDDTLISGPTPTTTPAYTVTGLTAGTTYYFYVVGLTAPNTEGNRGQRVYGSTKLAAPKISSVTTATGWDAFSLKVSWDSVTGANRYDVYRDGELIREDLYGTTYTDTGTDNSGLAVDTLYTYQVAAKTSSYPDATSAPSTASTPAAIQPAALTLGSGINGSLSVSGEVDYYRFTVPSNGNYYFYYNQYLTSGLYVARRLNDGSPGWYSVTEEYGQLGTFSFSAGDEVILAIRAYTDGETGNYYLRPYKN
jgi:hypothetical protein